MDYSELLRHVDHTLLTPTATWDQVKTVCDEGLTCRTASVCIPPRYVKRAAAFFKLIRYSCGRSQGRLRKRSANDQRQLLAGRLSPQCGI